MTDSGTELQQPTETPKQKWDRIIDYTISSFRERADVLKALEISDTNSFKSMMESISQIEGIQPEYFSIMTRFANLDSRQKEQVMEIYESYLNFFKPQDQEGTPLRAEHKIALFCGAIRMIQNPEGDQDTTKKVVKKIKEFFSEKS